MMRLLPPVSLVLLLAAAAVGCGGSSGDTAAKKPRPEAPHPTSEASKEAREAGSPAARVLELWKFASDGVVPATVLEYHPQVRADVGDGLLAAFFSGQQQRMAQAEPTVVEVRNSPAGRLVTVVATDKADGQQARYIYVLARSAGKWLIAYDSYLSSVIEAFSAQQAQANIDATKPPAAAARRQGLQTAAKFRVVPIRIAEQNARRAEGGRRPASRATRSQPPAAP